LEIIIFIGISLNTEARADPELRNCGLSHFKRPFIRDETELEMNTLCKKKT
jgi:hypothetical protein